jgi:tetratricopeptide (TPR) repeat protein
MRNLSLPSIMSLVIGLMAAGAAHGAQETPKSESSQEASSSSSIDEIREAYSQRRNEDVIVLADRALHDITMKGDVDQRAGELHFWRGAALRKLGRDKEALVALEESKARGFSKPELHLELALVRRTQGDLLGADRDYQEAERILPSDLEKRERLIDRWNREGKDEPRFKIILSPQFGYDSNIVGLDPNTPLLQGTTHFDSAYLGAYLDTRWFLVRNNHQTLELDYQNMARDYPSSQRLSFDDNVLGALGRQPLSELIDLEVRASLEEAFMKDDGHFRSQKTIGTGFLLYPLHDLQLHVYGDWSNGTYYDATPPEQNRDGDIYRIGVEAAIDLGRGWTMGPYVILNKYNAKGSDYVSQGWEGGLTLRPEEFLGFKVSATLDVSEQDYANLNSLSNFTVKRRDLPVQITLSVVFKQIERLIGYAPALSITYVHHDSNIAEFNYHRWSPQIDLGINVLSF